MKVKVEYLFSKNEKIGSRAISWGTNHLTKNRPVPSHMALLVNGRWVHESTLETGVRVISYDKWKEINEEVAKVPCAQEYREYSEVKAIYREMKNKDYDWAGVTYLGWYLFLNRYFGVKIPNENKWERKHKYFCCEAVAKMTGLEDWGMKSPVEVMDYLLSCLS